LAEKQGTEFKRADFILKVRNLLLFTTTIPKAMIDPSLWLQIVGLLQLVRARIVDGTNEVILPTEQPPPEYYTGNLCYTTLRAVAPLVRVEKGPLADTYSFVPGCADLAHKMVEQLRSGVLPASASYVIAERKKRQEKAEKDLASAKKRTLSPEAVQQLERQEQTALHTKQRGEISRLGKTLLEKAIAFKYQPSEMRDQLVREGAIPSLSQAEVVSCLADKASMNTTIAAILANVESRKAMIESLADCCTHQDV